MVVWFPSNTIEYTIHYTLYELIHDTLYYAIHSFLNYNFIEVYFADFVT